MQMLKKVPNKYLASKSNLLPFHQASLIATTLSRLTIRLSRLTKRTLIEMKAFAPDIDWDTFFDGLGVTDIGDPVLESVQYFSNLSHLVTTSEFGDVKFYLKFCVLNSAAKDLTSAFVDEDFNFNQRILRGVEFNEPLWKGILRMKELSVQMERFRSFTGANLSQSSLPFKHPFN
jgi:predicted metalloendopeptidase